MNTKQGFLLKYTEKNQAKPLLQISYFRNIADILSSCYKFIYVRDNFGVRPNPMERKIYIWICAYFTLKVPQGLSEVRTNLQVKQKVCIRSS